jgi:hypothetical protein
MSLLETMHRFVNFLMAKDRPQVQFELKTSPVPRYGDNPIMLYIGKYQVTVEVLFRPGKGGGWIERFGIIDPEGKRCITQILNTAPKVIFSCNVDVKFYNNNQATCFHISYPGLNLSMPRLLIDTTVLSETEIQRCDYCVNSLKSFYIDRYRYKTGYPAIALELLDNKLRTPSRDRLSLGFQYVFINLAEFDDAQGDVVNYCIGNSIIIDAATS